MIGGQSLDATVKVEVLFAVQAELHHTASWWSAPGRVLGAGVEVDALQRLQDVTGEVTVNFQICPLLVLLKMIYTLHQIYYFK